MDSSAPLCIYLVRPWSASFTKWSGSVYTICRFAVRTFIVTGACAFAGLTMSLAVPQQLLLHRDLSYM